MAGRRRSASARKKANIRSELRRDLIAIAMFAAGVFLAFCLWQAPLSGDKNLIGAIGFAVHHATQLLFGQGKWFPVAALILLGAGGWLKAAQPGKALYVAYSALVLSACAIAHLRLPD